MQNYKPKRSQIFNIPNLLSFFRLALIPVIVWLYCGLEHYALATVVLIVSGLTDIADGYIARRFDMITDFGKVFDPVADKLTQIATLFCLATRFEVMVILLVLLIVKEVIAAITGLMVIHRTGIVMSALWHGKATTFMLYTTMIVHLIWFKIPVDISLLLTGICTVMIVFSAVLYCRRNTRALAQAKSGD